MGLDPETQVQRAVRVRHLAGTPMSYLVTSIPMDLAARIAGQDMSQTPLLLLLEAAGVRAATATQTISATLADPEVSAALSVPAGAPLIEVRRTVFDTDGRALEYIRILYRPELYRFEMTMHRIERPQGRVWSSSDTLSLEGPP